MLPRYKTTRVVEKKRSVEALCEKKKKVNTAISMLTKILVIKLEGIVQLNLIEYKKLTQTASGEEST